MEHPLPFITTDESGKLRVNSDVILPILSGAIEPVSIVSIVGKYRTGKSYIMNRIFNQNAGFSLGETVQSKTKGIWIWARPHPLEPKRTLLLLDTEGLHDVLKGDDTHDMELFSLCLLLSNCLVYNATGTLDDVIIQQLNLVTRLTERIKIRENKSEDEDEGNKFSMYFPSFFLLLRDFFLELTLDGKACSPDEYMENALKLKKGSSDKVVKYNQPRECIRGYFPTRKCYTLCKPVDDDAKLRNLDKVPEGEIKEEFLAAAKRAIDDFLKEAKPFTVDSNVINGPRFIQLAGMYVDAINNNGIPCIASAMEQLKSNECQRALDDALSIFSDMMDESLKDKMPVGDDYLSAVQKTAHTAAIAHYNANSLFDQDGNFMKTLAKKLDKKYEGYNEENNSLSMKRCNELLEKCFQNVDEKMNSLTYMCKGGFNMYRADKDQAVENYNEAAKNGPMVEQTLNLFLIARKTEETAIINADKALGKKDKQLAKEYGERQIQEKRLKAAEEEQTMLKAELRRQKEEQAEILKKHEQALEEHQSKIQEEYALDMQKKQSEYELHIQQGSVKQAEMFKEIITEMREDKKQMENEYKRHRDEIEEYKMLQTKMLAEVEKDKNITQKRIYELEAEARRARKPTESTAKWYNPFSWF